MTKIKSGQIWYSPLLGLYVTIIKGSSGFRLLDIGKHEDNIHTTPIIKSIKLSYNQPSQHILTSEEAFQWLTGNKFEYQPSMKLTIVALPQESFVPSDNMARAIDEAVQSGHLDSRSKIADARLLYTHLPPPVDNQEMDTNSGFVP